jgi:hypothetical protein
MPFVGNSKLMIWNGSIIELDSVDVTNGTLPAGGTWRMLGIPDAGGYAPNNAGYAFKSPCYEPGNFFILQNTTFNSMKLLCNLLEMRELAPRIPGPPGQVPRPGPLLRGLDAQPHDVRLPPRARALGSR